MTRNRGIRLSFLMCSLSVSLATSETAHIFEGKVQAFERPYFHDKRERERENGYPHVITSRSLHMRAKLVSLFRLLPRDSCIYAFPPTGCSLTRIHAGETASRTNVNHPYSLRTIKKNNIVNIDAKRVGFY